MRRSARSIALNVAFRQWLPFAFSRFLAGRPFAPRPALHRALDDEVRSRRAEPRSGAARRSERRPPRLCFAFSLSAPEIEAVGARHAGGLSNAVA